MFSGVSQQFVGLQGQRETRMSGDVPSYRLAALSHAEPWPNEAERRRATRHQTPRGREEPYEKTCAKAIGAAGRGRGVRGQPSTRWAEGERATNAIAHQCHRGFPRCGSRRPLCRRRLPCMLRSGAVSTEALGAADDTSEKRQGSGNKALFTLFRKYWILLLKIYFFSLISERKEEKIERQKH